MAEDHTESGPLVPPDRPVDYVLDIAAVVVGLVPWLGGPVGTVLGGYSTARRMGRIKEALEGVAEDLKDFESAASKEYVKTEEFEDLLEHTLRRVAEERNAAKRLILRDFLTGAIKEPAAYDEQLRLLRDLDRLQPAHVALLRAFLVPPGDMPNVLMGSPISTLRHRMPGSGEGLIDDLVRELNALNMTQMNSLRTSMTAHGSQDLRGAITPYGQRFLKFLRADAERPTRTSS